MAVAELATKISFVGSLKPLDKLNNGLDTAVKSIGVATVAFTTAGYAVHAFMQETLSLADAQGQLARETGVSVEAIQEWGYVASLNGSSAEAFQTSLEGLSKKIGETATQGSEDFNRLGISVRDSFGNVKSADVILGELSNRFKQLNLSKEQQADFLEKLGIDRTMIQTLNLSSEAMAKLKKEARSLGIVSQEETDRLIEYNDSVTKVRYGMNALKTKLSIALIPQMQKLSENFIKLLKANNGLIKNGLNKFAEVLEILFKAGFRFGEMLKNLFTDMTDGQKMLAKLVAGFYLFNKVIVQSPLGRLATLITAVFVAIDDLQVGMKGGKSVISEWFKSFNIDALGRAKLLIGEMKVAVEQLAWTFNNLLLGGAKVSNLLGADFDIKALRKDIEENNRIIEEQRKKNQALYKEIQEREIKFEKLNLNQNSMLAKTATNNTNNNMQQTNNVTFNIKSTDPIKVSDEIQRQMKNANAQFSTGGR